MVRTRDCGVMPAYNDMLKFLFVVDRTVRLESIIYLQNTVPRRPTVIFVTHSQGTMAGTRAGGVAAAAVQGLVHIATCLMCT